MPKTKSIKSKKQEKEAFFSLLTDFDIGLFKSGKHYKLYEKLGAHLVEHNGVKGTYFAVWAPNARRVSVIGNFNFWNPEAALLSVRWDGSGIWEGFIPGVGKGEAYKYAILPSNSEYLLEKADPFAIYNESPPNTASIVWDLDFKWTDKVWLNKRAKAKLDQPYSVYEMHIGSWRRKLEEGNRHLTYGELAQQLVEYLLDMGFTHVEFMPVMEHPFYGSWGYQSTGYFAPSARFGEPQDLMYLIQQLHKNKIGVILDWVPSHFPTDRFALAEFDGSHLFEHADARKGFHPDWKSYIFNYGRYEVRSFLISSAFFWLDKFHADGLRVDAVASMLYLDYSRDDGEWIPNEFGGKENTEAISFMKELNTAVYQAFPGIHTIAEESTSWPMVSRPVELGGLGFGMKWMMGWMHDTLEYFKKDPIYRTHHQGQLTFSIHYAFSENFMLPLSHDEVVYGKGSLIEKMPGDQWQKFANLRLLYMSMYTHPGAKLLFMGGEFAQYAEWSHEKSLDWHLLQFEPHRGVSELIKSLNHLYQTERAMFDYSFTSEGFEWIDTSDHQNCVLSFLRKGKRKNDILVMIANYTPVPRRNYKVGVPLNCSWNEVLNSDEQQFWGSGILNPEKIKSEKEALHGRDYSVSIDLPPLGMVVLKPIKNSIKKP